MASDTYHEPYELLSEETRNMHRAIISVIEELEAIDWYQQRADACSDPELKAVLIHNKNEEIEHAMMGLEWIRRHSATFDENLRTYIFAPGPITEIEEAVTGGPNEKGTIEKRPASGSSGGGGAAPRGGDADGSLGIGSLRGGV
jgi:ferritin-like protein